MLTILRVLLVSPFLIVLAAAAYQAVATALDRRRYPAPGLMVDVGGRRLHLYATGQGAPTVVLDSGLPGTCLSWSFVQPEAAKLTRVCSYDRAGLGWSDAGPMPRTTERIVEELHTLLVRAEIEPPYVLVGHSFGGFTARRYAARYPDEVAGMVLVDPAHPSEWMNPAAEQRQKLEMGQKLARRAARFARFGIVRLQFFLVSAGLSQGPGNEGLVAALRKLPPKAKAALRAFWSLPKTFEAMASQMEFLPASAAQVQMANTGPYGDMPLVVLSASDPSPEKWREQEAAAALSSQGKHRVASESGHWIHIDEPRLVVDAIREVVEAVRRRQKARSARAALV